MSDSGPQGPLVTRNNKILTWYRRRHYTFCANRPLTGVKITLIRCSYRVTGVPIGQGDFPLSGLPLFSIGPIFVEPASGKARNSCYNFGKVYVRACEFPSGFVRGRYEGQGYT